VELRCIPTLLSWDAAEGCATAGAPRLDKALEAAADEAAVTALAQALFTRAA
jgi:hypothetical protein